jgi:hypothetical protein
MSEYDRICDYCHAPVSVFESVTEYGKHWHDRCYIHKTNKEIEDYKKKWINGKMTKGDKADLVDKFALIQNLKTESREFRGFIPIDETESASHELLVEDKVMLVDADYCSNGIQNCGDDGKPVFVSAKTPAISIRTPKLRPDVAITKHPVRQKILKSAEEILQIGRD